MHFIAVFWKILELIFHGQLITSTEDTIISCILFWYIYKSELLLKKNSEERIKLKYGKRRSDRNAQGNAG